MNGSRWPRPALTALCAGTLCLAAAPAGAQVTIYQSGFEGTNGGWVGDNDWARGVPSSAPAPCDGGAGGPASAFEGLEVWATGLDTCYTNCGCDMRLSQNFDLSTAISPELSFQQFLEVFGEFDFVQVNVNGNEAYRYDDDAPVGWEQVVIDLSAYEGQSSVTIEFLLHATTVVNRPGWYIDDVRITGDLPVDSDLEVGVAASASELLVGDTLTYTVTARNRGNTALNNVVVNTTLDPLTTYLSSSMGLEVAGTHTVNITSLAPLDNQVYTIDVSVDAAGTLVATVNGAATEADPDTGNNTANVAVTAIAAPVNDDCADAVVLTLGDFVSGTTVAASQSTTATCGADERDVWYAFPPAPNTAYRFTATFFDTAGSIAAFDGCIGAQLACGTGTTTTPAFVDVLSNSLGSAILLRVATDTLDESLFDIVVEPDPTPPPTNDACAGATLVNTFPFSDFVNTTDATPDVPAAAVSGCNTTAATAMLNSVWYEVQVAVESQVTATFSDTGDLYDMVAGVWEGTCGSIADPAIVCDDEPEPISLVWVAQPGVSYFVKVGEWGSSALSGDGGGTNVTIEALPLVPAACCFNDGTCTDADPVACASMGGRWQGEGTTCGTFSCPDFSPINDLCSDAILVPGFPFSDTRDSAPATPDAPAAAISGCNSTTATDMDNAIWYRIAPTETKDVTITVTEIDSYDMVAAVWEGDCFTIVDPPLVCDGDPEPIVMSFRALAGHSYLLAVGDFGAGTTVGVGGLTQIDITGADPRGACCIGGSCSIVSAAECGTMGGTYQGDDTSCGGEFVDTEPGTFVDISGTGTALNLADDGETTVPTGLLGNIRIANNGGVAIGATTGDLATTNTALPATGTFVTNATEVYFPFWDDLDADIGNVYWQEMADRVIVQWHSRPHFSGSASLVDGVTFQIQLFAPGGNIKAQYIYQDVSFDPNQSATGGCNGGVCDGGASATVGWQDATLAAEFSFNSAVLQDGMVLSVVQSACEAPPTCVCETDGNAAQVNVFDLLAYLDDWFGQSAAADIDGTPGVNVFDLLFFLDCWFPASAGNPC